MENTEQNRKHALGDLRDLNWTKVFGLDIEAIYHGALAVIGTATGVVVLICLCKARSWLQGCCGGREGQIRHQANRQWHRLSHRIQNRGRDFSMERGSGYVSVDAESIPLPELPREASDVVGPVVPDGSPRYTTLAGDEIPEPLEPAAKETKREKRSAEIQTDSP